MNESMIILPFVMIWNVPKLDIVIASCIGWIIHDDLMWILGNHESLKVNETNDLQLKRHKLFVCVRCPPIIKKNLQRYIKLGKKTLFQKASYSTFVIF